MIDFKLLFMIYLCDVTPQSDLCDVLTQIVNDLSLDLSLESIHESQSASLSSSLTADFKTPQVQDDEEVQEKVQEKVQEDAENDDGFTRRSREAYDSLHRGDRNGEPLLDQNQVIKSIKKLLDRIHQTISEWEPCSIAQDIQLLTSSSSSSTSSSSSSFSSFVFNIDLSSEEVSLIRFRLSQNILAQSVIFAYQT
eukprot:CAMPEP_0114401932 /NCGR_PEP_ID=MMETSP0102-20121206/17613_1 /TAXON_ID=38822 ORGANISM="Pteridomonas danica, Strain PT" /NCGR_SAMPLE_ID=MMETSP0102 /ASSEMBLY_ACC=CAM_ASM_000212 /LENGTH=194 /DNA_ID=CAMNT_0001565247 /DNA_START=33 /DNA_END=613 /DNA_ORIENTATION=-